MTLVEESCFVRSDVKASLALRTLDRVQHLAQGKHVVGNGLETKCLVLLIFLKTLVNRFLMTDLSLSSYSCSSMTLGKR